MTSLPNEKRRADILSALAIFIYFASYLTRVNFTGIVSEFIASEGVAKSSTSIIIAATTIVYGAGQLISGYLGDKFNPKLLIFGGFVLTVSMNVLMPIAAPNVTLMTVIWGLNGFAQSFMWPPLVRILSTYLSTYRYLKIMPLFGFSTGGASIAIYLFSPFIIRSLGWRYVFYFCAAFGAIAAIVWMVVMKKITQEDEETGSKEKNAESGIVKSKAYEKIPILIFSVISLTLILQGSIKEGVNTWSPSFISESFGIEASSSIQMTVLFPLFYIFFNFFVYYILHKIKNDVLLCLTGLYSLLALSSLAIFFFGRSSVFVSVPILTLISGVSQSINSLQTCCLPYYFKNTGKISLVSGILNGFVYVGSSVSTYLFALSAEKDGWGTTLLSWIILSVIGIALTVLSLVMCRKKGYKYD